VSRPLVHAPLRLEATALRRGLATSGAPGVDAVEVSRSGMGRRRARAAARTASRDDRPVCVAGLGGALVVGLRPGDVVVATEVRADGRIRPLPSAHLLAASLRRRGLTVVLGPVLTLDRVVSEPGRAALARTGAVAVDMESADLLAGVDGPAAVVRVIVDGPGQPLLHPRVVRAGPTALRSLRRTAPALAEWAAAVGPRRLLLAGPRSFCAGVERAIEVVERALERYGAPVYVRRQIVHNRHVVADLEHRGAIFVQELDDVPAGATVVFSAHGVAPAVRAQAAEKNLVVIDATCPLVSKVHTEARRFAGRGDTVVLIGHAGHDEVEGTLGQVPGATRLVESVSDVEVLDVPDPDRISYLMQTTLAVDEAETVVEALRARFPRLSGPDTRDICYATSNRQAAVRAVAEAADLVLVVGSGNSSNSARLVEIASRAGTPSYLVDDAGDVDLRWLAGVRTVGITAGASAPPPLVDQLVEELRGLGPVEVEEHEVVRESQRFGLPREVG
jgi:4-hydroxy-3-methylbut-2-en-1-yl diphosphate reductase